MTFLVKKKEVAGWHGHGDEILYNSVFRRDNWRLGQEQEKE